MEAIYPIYVKTKSHGLMEVCPKCYQEGMITAILPDKVIASGTEERWFCGGLHPLIRRTSEQQILGDDHLWVIDLPE